MARKPTTASTGAAPHWLIEVALLLAFFGALAFSPELGRALRAWLPAPAIQAVQTSALGRCNPPAPPEQLHVIWWYQGGVLVHDCMYVGARGTYARKGAP